MQKQAPYFLAILSIIIITGCASIIHGPSQSVDFSSQPTGAKIFIDGEHVGVTPQSFELRRKGRPKGDRSGKKEYAVKIELEGYYPYEVKLKREMDGWLLGNLLLGGVIGIIIDAANGSMYKLNPNQVIAQPTKITAYNPTNSETLYVAVSLQIDPRWEKIGQLEKIK